MRRLTLSTLLVSLPFVLAACAPETVSIAEGTTPAAEPASASASASDSEPEVLFPILSLDESRVGLRGLYVLKGKVENAKVPATFHLKSESGCARDKKLHTTTIGMGVTVALDGADLADAFGCAIDVEADGNSLSPIAVSPNAEAAAAKGLSLDPSVAIVSASLDPNPAHMVRFTIIADRALQTASVDLGGKTYRATLAPLDSSTEGGSTAIFEVPASAWADAVLAGSIAHVTTTETSGKILSIDVKPTVDVTLVGMDGDGDCDA